jgi:hypothetical protein
MIWMVQESTEEEEERRSKEEPEKGCANDVGILSRLEEEVVVRGGATTTKELRPAERGVAV